MAEQLGGRSVTERLTARFAISRQFAARSSSSLARLLICGSVRSDCNRSGIYGSDC